MKNEILKIVEVAYKKGYLDGLNYHEDLTGDEKTTEKEFNDSWMLLAMDEEIEKLAKGIN